MRTNDAQIHTLSRKLALFTDPVRLKLLLFLFSKGRKDLCVSDMAKYLGCSLSNTSHQLRKLELARLVEPVRQGRMICYRVRKTRNNMTFYHHLTHLI